MRRLREVIGLALVGALALRLAAWAIAPLMPLLIVLFALAVIASVIGRH